MRSLACAIRAAGRWLTAALVLWALGWQATGDTLAPVRAGLYVAPFVLLLAGVLAVLALVAGRRLAALAAGSVAVLLAVSAPASLTRPVAQAPRSGLTLTTLSNRTSNADMAATARALRAHQADIFVLQEIADPAALVAALAGLYRPGDTPDHCVRGTYLIVSRYRVAPAVRLAGNIAVRCRIALPGGDAMVYSVHLPRALGDAGQQTRAIATLLDDAARQTHPAILAGDFNATPLTTTMRQAGGALTNAFDRAGSGPGFTFPTPARRLGTLGPFLRIDHVLLDPAFRPLSANAARWHPPEADHYPVEIDLSDLRGLRG